MKGKTMCTGMTSFNQPDGWISVKDRLPDPPRMEGENED